MAATGAAASGAAAATGVAPAPIAPTSEAAAIPPAAAPGAPGNGDGADVVASAPEAAMDRSARYVSRASAMAAAVGNRSPGSSAMARRTIASRAGGMPARTSAISGGRAARRAIAIAAALSPSNGRRPVSIS